MLKKGLCILLAGSLAGCQSLGLAILNIASPRVTAETGLPYAPGPRGTFDVYRPTDASATLRPLVLFWYGGAFTKGERADYRFVGATLAAHGMVAVVPDYRLYPEVGFPGFLQDAAQTVAAAQREAGRWGADPCRIVLIGHSAGAYIAAMLALDPGFLRDAGVDPGCIRGWVGLSGPYDLEPNTGTLHAIFTRHASPDQFKPVRLAGESAPPALLVHGNADETVWPQHSVLMAESLSKHGVSVAFHRFDARRHVDTVVALSRPGRFRIPELQPLITDFVATHTRP